jgi:sugar phosphate isomerase/epimerase
MTDLTRRAFCGAGLPLVVGLIERGAQMERAVRRTTLPRLGVQAGILRALLTTHFEGTLAQVAASGYATIELQWYGGNFHRTPREIRRACDAAGLRVPSALIRAGAMLVGWERHLAAAREIGIDHLSVVNLSDDEVQSLDDWREWADRFNEAGAVARRAGVWLALHNEPAFMTAVGSHVPYDEFVTRTDPAVVALSMDAANMTRGGADPLTYLRKHRDRYRLGHLKDVTTDNAVGGTFGEGRLALAEVIASLSEPAAQLQFIEHPLRQGREFDDLRRIAQRLLG